MAADFNERKQQVPCLLKQGIKKPSYAFEDPFAKDAALLVGVPDTLAKLLCARRVKMLMAKPPGCGEMLR